jgi:hypothetical protein
MAASVQRAVLLDQSALMHEAEQTEREQHDRALAVQLSAAGGGPESSRRNRELIIPPTAPAATSSDDDGLTIARSFLLELGGEFTDECVACFDTHLHKGLVATLTCEHTYCYPCVAALCMTALSDEQLLPVRCCNQEMPSKVFQRALNEDQLREFETALVEHNCANRMYCPNPVCSIFIGERGVHVKASRTCDSCTVLYCASCGDAWHDGVCRKDRADEEELRTLAASEGWQQCSRCKQIVELVRGCNHMTCKCGFEFCYTCGAGWKPTRQCTCELWDEHRLLDAAQLHVEAHPEIGGVQQAARHIVAAHVSCEQDGHRLLYVRRTGDCEHCGRHVYNKPAKNSYETDSRFRNAGHHGHLFMCASCKIEVCRRCAHNRVHVYAGF